MSFAEVSIATSAFPLVFRVDSTRLDLEPLPAEGSMAHIRTMARPLAGMQKEALIQYGPTGTTWRVVCDEGPWLNGTDLAPFPLAFFTAGLAASFMTAFLDEASERNIRVDSVKLEQVNSFTMEGSALRGTMTASAQPVEVSFSADGSASNRKFEEIAAAAVKIRCPAERCLNQDLASNFVVRANNEVLPWPGESSNKFAELADPENIFDRVCPSSEEQLTIIRKLSGPAETDTDAVGLQAEQKRTVRVFTQCTLRDDGLKSIEVQCIQPAGSRFEFLSDDSQAAGGLERAPSGLAYLSAGVAFCFMTQVGRYAQITRQKLNDYRIIQDTGFGFAHNCEPAATAVETLICLDTGETPDKSLQLVKMSEQTCYIHASYRMPMKTNVSFHALRQVNDRWHLSPRNQNNE